MSLPCDGETELFFLADADPFEVPPGSVIDALADVTELCSWCPQRVQCAATAIARNERAGVWGGLRTEERDRVAAAILKELTNAEA